MFLLTVQECVLFYLLFLFLLFILVEALTFPFFTLHKFRSPSFSFFTSHKFRRPSFSFFYLAQNSKAFLFLFLLSTKFEVLPFPFFTQHKIQRTYFYFGVLLFPIPGRRTFGGESDRRSLLLASGNTADATADARSRAAEQKHHRHLRENTTVAVIKLKEQGDATSKGGY